ncbi:RNA polymerase sigma factor [Prevotella sp. AGR2160]|uniref:RNA polymerase sigma factor n=1 Tax=Prevotella sp. AGR2160 TaxID=1280674 RepID=UPI00048C2EAB|nr:sigma-70 family RNA polymerase sigma factor [Prevotella sp. AGR2160]
MKKISFTNDILPLKNIIYRVALRITLNREESEDITQDTLVKVWNNRDNWDHIDSIEAYSLTIARNLALDRKKLHDNQVRSLDESPIERPDHTSNPYEQMQQKDEILAVKKLVDDLPEKQRSCMQLRDFEGKSYKEIAVILGITEEQVKVNIFRARQTVKQNFKKFDRYGL